MCLRLTTGVIGAAVVVGAIWLGFPWLILLALLGGGLAIREAYRLTPPGIAPMPVPLGVIAVAALLLASEAAAGSSFYFAAGLVLAAWAFTALLWFIACYQGEQVEGEDSAVENGPEEDAEPLERACPDAEPSFGRREAEASGWGERPWLGFLFLLLGPVYIGFLLGHGLAMQDLSGGGDLGRNWLLFTLLVVFACDTGAFAVGRTIGRRPMVPRLSPRKTWEGAAGGFAASIGAALLAGMALDLSVLLWQQALIGAVAGVAAQGGDLFESALKRAANVKDSGNIMPGHGGILDRMDSILFALPAVFYMLLAVGLRL